MKYRFVIMLFSLMSCIPSNPSNSNQMIAQSKLENKDIQAHEFLPCMYRDPYFPKFLVDKCKVILLSLCLEIENTKPQTVEDLYALTHESTKEVNALEDEFFENGSEIETAARECLAESFAFVAKSYGFDADIEELIATRDW